ncbi:hypothetical protein [Helicobacter mustelae]|uniref:hypothetical protein n=1 Tax=Helicobacter mustelae TaxID=217 RepID=UPI000E0E7DE9|nr:hypothetical protein [Helicobacter mustelae]
MCKNKAFITIELLMALVLIGFVIKASMNLNLELTALQKNKKDLKEISQAQKQMLTHQNLSTQSIMVMTKKNRSCQALLHKNITPIAYMYLEIGECK